MRKPVGFLPALALGVASAVGAAFRSLAIPITYTEQATATGSLGGVIFTNGRSRRCCDSITYRSPAFARAGSCGPCPARRE
jgi:hypothetical protein